MADGDNKLLGTPIAGTVETNDDTWTDLAVYTMADNRTALLFGKVVAQRLLTGADMETFLFMAAVNAAGGTVTVRSSGLVEQIGTGLAWDVRFLAAGATAKLQVQGGVGVDVRWFGCIEVVQVEVT